VLEIKHTVHRGRMAISGQNVIEAEKRTSSISRKRSEIGCLGLTKSQWEVIGCL